MLIWRNESGQVLRERLLGFPEDMDPHNTSTLISEERPSKRAKLLLDDDETSDSSSNAPGGVSINQRTNGKDNSGFRVNEEYARRFEHNQRRAEIHRCVHCVPLPSLC